MRTNSPFECKHLLHNIIQHDIYYVYTQLDIRYWLHVQTLAIVDTYMCTQSFYLTLITLKSTYEKKIVKIKLFLRFCEIFIVKTCIFR